MEGETEFSWARSVALAFAIAVHIALLALLGVPPETRYAPVPAPGAESLDWIDIDEAVAVDLLPPYRPSAAAPEVRRAANVEPRPVSRPRPRHRDVAPSGSAPAPAASPLDLRQTLFDDSGRAVLPASQITLGDGSADAVFYRPRALETDTTRFERAWRPSETLIDEWNRRLGEAITTEVRIPLNPKFDLVCGVTVVGIGSCLIVRMGGSGVIVERGPPPSWERAQRVQCVELRRELASSDDVERVAYLLDRLAALCAGP